MQQNFFGQPKTRIIFAADLLSYDENARVLDEIHEDIDVIKVNNPLIYNENGVKVIRKLVDRYKKPVFADIKVGDVTHTDSSIVKIMKDNGASAAMIHGFVGPDAILECLKVADNKIGIIIQLELTNPGGKLFTAPISEQMARLYSSFDVYGFQSPGNRTNKISIIRNIVGNDKIIVCCGVGKQGGTYSGIVNSGGTYAIIGRSIYLSNNPKQAIDEIIRN